MTGLAILLVFLRIVTASEIIINAGIVGYWNDTSFDQYLKTYKALSRRDHRFCSVHMTAVEYDTNDGSSVLQSLEHARKMFENEIMTVAIGPSIDVFTSTDYVIQKQAHFVTTIENTLGASVRAMPIFPDTAALADAIGLIAKKFRWRKVAFLSQDDFTPVLSLSNQGIFVWPLKLPAQITSSAHSELKKTLTTLREANMDKFILHSMKKDVVTAVIDTAKKLHLLHHSLSWFVTYLDFEDIAENLKETATLYGLQLLHSDKIPTELTENASVTLSRLDLGRMVDSIGLLLFYLRNSGCDTERAEDEYVRADDFKRYLDNLKHQPDPYNGVLGSYSWSGQSRDGTANHRIDYTIRIFQYKNELEQVGNCTIEEGKPVVSFNLSSINGYHSRTEALQGKTFQVITRLDEPFVMKRGDNYVGFCVDVLEELKAGLKFEYNISEVQSLKNSKESDWDNVLQQLIVGNASMAVGALAVSADRQEDISFSYTLVSSTTSILLKKSKSTRNFFQFLGPFSVTLWILILVFFGVVGLCMFLLTRFDSSQKGREQTFDLKESLWYSLNILLQGTPAFPPQTTSTRTIVAFSWFCTLIITAAYTANLAAYLTLQQIDNRMTTVEDLARQTKVKYGVLNNSDLMHFFEDSLKDPYERMWAYMKLNEKNSILPTRIAGVKKVMDDSFAYLDDGLINTYFSQQYCGIESIDQNFEDKHFSMGFPKGAPYRDDINRALLKMKELGILDQLRQKWWEKSKNCTDDDTTVPYTEKTTAELEIDNMFGVFIVLIACIVLSILFEIGNRVVQCCRHTEPKGGPAEKEAEANDKESEDVNKAFEEKYKADYV